MPEAHASRGAVRFGVFEVDLHSGELRKQGFRVRLQEQPFQILQILLEHPGEVVTREELQKRIWPDTFVDFEHGVYNAVKRLREALGDTADTPRFIETLPRRGYRFIGTANGSAQAAPANGSPPIVETHALPRVNQRPPRTEILIGLGLAALLLAILEFTPNKWWQRLQGSGDVPRIRSIAVLPLQNLSGDPAQEYFADGMTEELITELSHLSALKVVSRTSVMRYKKTDKPLPEIAQELGVDGIVEGSVLRSGDRVRITAQLIYAPRDTNLWAQTYDRELRDALTLQGTVAAAIAREIKVEVTPQEQSLLKNLHPVNRKALDAYLDGQRHLADSNHLAYTKTGWPKQSDEEIRKALASFQQAIQEDPNYVPAYLGLSEAWGSEWLSAGNDLGKAKAAAAKAVELDDTLAKAHQRMARILILHDRDWVAAEKEFIRALEISPGSADAHDQYAAYLENLGRWEQAQREYEWAQQLDPDAVHLPDFDLSPVEQGRRYMATHQVVPIDNWIFANNSYTAGMYKEAVDNWTLVMDRYGWTEEANRVRRSYSVADPTRAAKQLTKEIEDISKYHWLPPSVMIEFYTALDDQEHILAWLQKGFAEHEWDTVFSLGGSQHSGLLSDPRFQDLARRAGLPPPP